MARIREAWEFLGGLAIAVAFVVAMGTPTAADRSRTGFDPEQPFSGGNDWEPYVAADPSSSFVYMVTTGRDARECLQCPQPSITYRVSPDRGASWGPVKFVCGVACRRDNIAGPWQFDPTIAVARDGTVFVAWLDNWNPGPLVATSTDHGATFQRPVVAGKSGGGWVDKPWIAISDDGRDAYVAFTNGDPFVSASHDGGLSFGRPVKITPPLNKRYWFPEGGVVTPDGNVYFSMSIESTVGTGPVELVVLRSVDRGATWTVQTIDRSEEARLCEGSCGIDHYQAQIVIDADPTGTLMVAYMKTERPGGTKAFFSRVSTDGVRWSEARLIHDVADSNFPAITNGPTPGDFRVAWQDDRNGPLTAWNTFYKRTTNYGRSWSQEVRLSDLGSGAPYKTPEGYLFPYGDYFGIAADSGGRNYVIWGEGSGRGTGGGSWFTRGA
ncbi:MAG: sialidase family protein [Methanobacteriota archaeon]